MQEGEVPAAGRGSLSGYPLGNTQVGKWESHTVESGTWLIHSKKAHFNLGLGRESVMKC